MAVGVAVGVRVAVGVLSVWLSVSGVAVAHPAWRPPPDTVGPWTDDACIERPKHSLHKSNVCHDHAAAFILNVPAKASGSL